MTSHLSDIGFILFVQIFGMTEYPGSPFSGNIVTDIVQFFFVPSVFIILFIYMTLGRLFAPENRKMRLLVGLAIYLFIVVTPGLYRNFALLAGPYFLIFLIIIPAIYFIFSHFGVRRVAGAAPAGGGAGGGSMAVATAEGTSLGYLAAQKLNEIKWEVQSLRRSSRAPDTRGIVAANVMLGTLLAEFNSLKGQMKYTVTEKAVYEKEKARLGLNESQIIRDAERYFGEGR